MTTGPGTGRLSTSESARMNHELAMAALARTPRPLSHSIELSRNAKGDVQWTITVNREDPYEAEQDAREIHDRLTRAYPHSSLLEGEPSLKAALTASVAEQDAGKTAAVPSSGEESCAICGHLWRQHDPEDGCCDSQASDGSIGVCKCGRDMAWMHERTAALARRYLGSGEGQT